MVNKKTKSFKIFIVLMLALTVVATCFSGVIGAFGNNEKYLVSQGASEYKIVIAEDADSSIKTAGRELQIFFEEATDVQLPIITDDQTVSGGKYISIGKTSLLTSEVQSKLENLKSSGYVIKTVGNTLYLVGRTSTGSLYSVYGFLREALGFEYFHTNVYNLNKGVGDLELKDYDLSVNPDIDIMGAPNVGFIQNNSMNMNRFNVLTTEHSFIPANGTSQVHNLFKIIDPNSSIYEEHPEWFSDNKATGCFTAHTNLANPSADRTNYEEMLNYFLEVVKQGMKESSAETFMVSQPDNCGFCECAGCTASAAKFGGDSGIMVNFCNDLSRKVLAWLETAEGEKYDREFKLVFLAYQACAAAPTSDITCDENVGVYIAFDSYRSSYGLLEDKWNKSLYETVLGWSEKTSIFMFWIYDVNFEDYFYPYDTSAYKQDFYKVMKEVGTVYVNDQNQTQNANATAWGNLKAYISTKLRWNVNANTEELTIEYFKGCYKDAWKIMYDLYAQYKAHWAILKNKVELGVLDDQSADLRSIFGNLNKVEFWSRTMLEGWVSQYRQALEAIKPLEQTDKEAYDKAYKLVIVEMISPMYILLDLYASEYPSTTLVGMKSEFKALVQASDLGYYADGMTSGHSELFESLGIE